MGDAHAGARMREARGMPMRERVRGPMRVVFAEFGK